MPKIKWVKREKMTDEDRPCPSCQKQRSFLGLMWVCLNPFCTQYEKGKQAVGMVEVRA